MKKISFPITRYFSPKAKETIACTGIDPECQPVNCSSKQTKIYSVEVIIKQSDVLINSELAGKEILSGCGRLTFNPDLLVDRQSFVDEWFGHIGD